MLLDKKLLIQLVTPAHNILRVSALITSSVPSHNCKFCIARLNSPYTCEFMFRTSLFGNSDGVIVAMFPITAIVLYVYVSYSNPHDMAFHVIPCHAYFCDCYYYMWYSLFIFDAIYLDMAECC